MMKYEIKNAENSLFKTLIVLLFYLFVLFLSIYSFLYHPKTEEEIFNGVLNYLNYPMFKEYDFIERLLYIFNSMFFVLYFSLFYIYEHIHIHEIIATRYDNKSWVVHKYVIGILFVFLISLIEYGEIAYMFLGKMPVNIKYYLYPFLFKLLLMSFVFTLYNSFKSSKLMFLLLMPFVFFTLYWFNPLFSVIIFIIFFIINYFFFNLRIFKYIFIRNR